MGIIQWDNRKMKKEKMKKGSVIELRSDELIFINGGGPLGKLIGKLLGASATIAEEGGTLCSSMCFKWEDKLILFREELFNIIALLMF